MALILHTAIEIEDVECLEQVFTKLTEHGWVKPQWLVWLRNHVETKLTERTSDEIRNWSSRV